MNTLARAGAVAVGALLLVALSAAPAQAHNALRSTDPIGGQLLQQAPEAVELVFDEPAIALGTQVVITGPSGPVQQGPAQLVDRTVRQALVPGGPGGRYEVQWRVTSADGHPVQGSFDFTVAGPGPTSSHTASVAPSPTPEPSVSSGPAPAPRPGGLETIPAWAWWLTAAVAALALGAIGYHVRQRHR